MIKGLINSLVSGHLFVSELEEQAHDIYEVLHDKLEELTQAGHLPVVKGFYTEYLDEDEMDNLDDKFVVRNCLFLDKMKVAA